MPSSLPSVVDLIKDSWTLFVKSWNDTVKISIWFMYFGFAQFAAALVEKSSPWAGFGLTILVAIGVAVFGVWIAIRLMRAVLAIDAGGKIDFSPAELQRSWELFVPLLLVGILNGLIVLGGTVLLIIPGIFLAVALSFAQLLVLDKGLRGTDAIAASYRLVKDRWWATFWRQIAIGVVFGIGIAIVTNILSTMISAVAGPRTFTPDSPDPLVSGTFMLFQSIIQAAVLPLIVIAEVKIYRALQGARR